MNRRPTDPGAEARAAADRVVWEAAALRVGEAMTRSPELWDEMRAEMRARSKAVETTEVVVVCDCGLEEWRFQGKCSPGSARSWGLYGGPGQYFRDDERRRSMPADTPVWEAEGPGHDLPREKYNLRHCGIDIKVRPEQLHRVLDGLAAHGVSRVSLSGIAGIVSS